MVAPSAASADARGSSSGSASASRNANVAPAVQTAAMARNASTAPAGPRVSAAAAASPASANAARAMPRRLNSLTPSPRMRLFTAVAWMYTPEIESRANVCPAAGIGSAQRSAFAVSGAVAKRRDVSLRSSTSSSVPISTTLPAKWRRKKALSSFSTQACRSANEKVGMSPVPPAKLSVIVPGTAQRLLDTLSGRYRRVGDEAQSRGALEAHLTRDGCLELEALGLERRQGSLRK